MGGSGFKVTAFIRSGILGGFPSADECLADPSIAEDWGYNGPRIMKAANGRDYLKPIDQIPVGSTIVKILCHPERLTMPSIWSWLKNYEYSMKYHVAIPAEERHTCWLQAEAIYETYYKAGIDEWRRRNG